jgi:polyhydroxyalkanoate synthesis regulator phasin
MVNHGQIEDNDAKNLLSEIDKKIYNIKSEDIEIEIMDHKDRIAHLSDLAEVFSKEELE